jgi:hypothetical protein
LRRLLSPGGGGIYGGRRGYIAHISPPTAQRRKLRGSQYFYRELSLSWYAKRTTFIESIKNGGGKNGDEISNKQWEALFFRMPTD